MAGIREMVGVGRAGPATRTRPPAPHLYRARLFRDKAELAKARALIEKHGYWRRKEELEAAEEAL